MARKVITPRSRVMPKVQARAAARAPVTPGVVKTAKQRISEQIASRVPGTQRQLDLEAEVARRNAAGAGLGDTIPMTVDDIAEQIIIEQGGVPTPERVQKLVAAFDNKSVYTYMDVLKMYWRGDVEPDEVDRLVGTVKNPNIGAANRAMKARQQKLAKQLKKPLTPAQFDALEAESLAEARRVATAEDAVVERFYPGAGKKAGANVPLPDSVSRGDMHMAARAEQQAASAPVRLGKYANKAEQVAAINARKAARAAAAKGVAKGAATAAVKTGVKVAATEAAEVAAATGVKQIAKKGLARAAGSFLGGPVGMAVGGAMAAWTIWDIINALKGNSDEMKAGKTAALMNAVRGDMESNAMDDADRVAEAYLNVDRMPASHAVSPQVMTMLQNDEQGLQQLMPPRRVTFAELMQAAGIAQ